MKISKSKNDFLKGVFLNRAKSGLKLYINTGDLFNILKLKNQRYYILYGKKYIEVNKDDIKFCNAFYHNGEQYIELKIISIFEEI